ncbi:MAG TPA: hypothetical protein DCL77_08750 [Prolixibacteraceae bacterium]|jgi:hypothetical protein|nr:hypothetical protein [Prolixibacteraceae bacterium]
MRNLIALIAIVFFTSIAYSQTTTTKQVKKKTAAKTEVASPDGKQVANPAEKSGSKSLTATKKDGSPDKRYKSKKDTVKTTAPASSHLKKDGTPDMRYKENKSTAPKDKK